MVSPLSVVLPTSNEFLLIVFAGSIRNTIALTTLVLIITAKVEERVALDLAVKHFGGLQTSDDHARDDLYAGTYSRWVKERCSYVELVGTPIVGAVLSHTCRHLTPTFLL